MLPFVFKYILASVVKREYVKWWCMFCSMMDMRCTRCSFVNMLILVHIHREADRSRKDFVDQHDIVLFIYPQLNVKDIIYTCRDFLCISPESNWNFKSLCVNTKCLKSCWMECREPYIFARPHTATFFCMEFSTKAQNVCAEFIKNT